MERLKPTLERITKIFIIASTIMGIILLLFFLKIYLHYYPMIIKIHLDEELLLISMIILFLMTKRFKMKYLKWITIVGIILACINLFGFDILLNLTYKPYHFMLI